MKTLTIRKPDDWHVHLRDGISLKTTVPHLARCFARAIIMPNLKPPITDLAQAKIYFKQIKATVPQGNHFQPLLTLYLTDKTTPEMIKEAKASGLIVACKLYPAGATTHSEYGVKNIEKIYPVLALMSELSMPLLIHGEVVDEEIDIFEREVSFIEKVLDPLLSRFSELKIVLEHITTKDAVEYVKQSSKKLAATITAHHLLLNRNDLLVGGIKPHYYCLPILKARSHQLALQDAAISGSSKFFLGTDSAPHAKSMKENACGCAGIYTAHASLELYAEIFEELGGLDKLENFSSVYGADFYGLPLNSAHVTLIKKTWQVPSSFSYGAERLIPFRAGEKVSWQLIET